jgi:cell division protease FtsH
LLVEMDGFEANEGVILIAATNRPDVLDPALLRPGRFDRQVVVPNPDILGREKILKVHMRKVPLAPDVNAKTIARGTPGFSGADLANLVNEAALLAARKNRRVVSMLELEEAKDKVMMGAERRSMVMTEDEKRMTAYHEAGHALVMMHAPGHEPLHKVTIIPRGRALGVTMWLPERDKYAHSEKELHARIASSFGGRVAEELIYGKENITTGAAQDIQQATAMARAMITEYGYSDKLGPLRYSDNEEEVFLGHSVTQRKNVSEATQQLIDEEIRRLVSRGEHAARDILTERIEDLHIIAKGLLEYETLSREEIDMLLRGENITRGGSDENSSTPSSGARASVPSSGSMGGSVGGGIGPEPQPGS